MPPGEEGQGKALQPAFWAASETCIVCGSDAFEPGYGPQTLVTCECCLDRGVHIECWQARSGELLTEAQLEQPGFEWFCSEVRRPPPPSEAAAARRRRRETHVRAARGLADHQTPSLPSAPPFRAAGGSASVLWS